MIIAHRGSSKESPENTLSAFRLAISQGADGIEGDFHLTPKPSRDGEEARIMLTEAGLPLFKQGIRRYVAFQKAALAGIPVFETNDKQAKIAWTDYKAVGKEIINE